MVFNPFQNEPQKLVVKCVRIGNSKGFIIKKKDLELIENKEYIIIINEV